MTYCIVRYYHPSQNRHREVRDRSLTLAQVKKHCNDPKTEKPGEYFDGYAKES